MRVILASRSPLSKLILLELSLSSLSQKKGEAEIDNNREIYNCPSYK